MSQRCYFLFFTYSLDSFTIINASVVYTVLYFHVDLIILNGKTLIMTSPNFPGAYPNNAFIFWKIRTAAEYSIRVNIITFDTQRDSDYVCIGDGVHHFNSHLEEWRILSGAFRDVWNSTEFTSNSSFILLIFTSDGEGTDLGFRIELSGVYTGTVTTEVSTATEISSKRAHSEFISELLCKCLNVILQPAMASLFHFVYSFHAKPYYCSYTPS